MIDGYNLTPETILNVYDVVDILVEHVLKVSKLMLGAVSDEYFGNSRMSVEAYLHERGRYAALVQCAFDHVHMAQADLKKCLAVLDAEIKAEQKKGAPKK